MTFDGHHYVPVLKVKRGEKAALLAVQSSLRSRITPLLEIVERSREDLKVACDELIKTACENGGKDNITTILVECK